MFRFTILRRSCSHLTGYAAFAKVAFKMPVMETVPGGFGNKNIVSHDAWDRLGLLGRTEYSDEAKTVPLSALKREKKLIQLHRKKARSSYLFHSVSHPGWKAFVQKNYMKKEIQKLPFDARLDALAHLHEAELREKRRLHNLELRRNNKKRKSLTKTTKKAKNSKKY